MTNLNVLVTYSKVSVLLVSVYVAAKNALVTNGCMLINLDTTTDTVQLEEIASKGNSWLSTHINRFGIGGLLLVLAALHLFVINFPSQTGQYVFDEAYYMPDSYNLIQNVASNMEHPFLGKVWILIGELLAQSLGGSPMNTFFPRLIQVGFGLGAVYLFYLLCRNWFSPNVSLFAAALLGLDTLFFVHTSLALLDGPPLFFGFGAILFYFYWRRSSNDNYLMMSAILFGLAILSKETAVLFVVIIGLYHLITTNRSELRLKLMIEWAAVIAFIVILALTAYDAVFNPVVTFPSGPTVALHYGWQNIQYMVAYQGALKIQAGTPSALDPWHYALGWINPLTVAPDPYYVTTISVEDMVVGHPIDWLGIGNLALWYSIYPLVGYLLYKVLRSIRNPSYRLSPLETLVALWVMVEYGAALYTSYVVHRIVYAFYMLDLTPALVLGVSLMLIKAAKTPQERRAMMLMFLGEAIVWFVIYLPVHPWLN